MLSSVDKQGERRKFTIGNIELESGLDLVFSLISTDYGIDDITLIAENTTIKLPLDVFDGQSFKDAINQLKSEWQFLLSHSVLNRLAQTEAVVRIVQTRIAQDETMIAFLESAITRMALQLGQFKPIIDFTAVEQCNHLIDRYQKLITNAHKRKEANVQRLKRLVK